MWICASRIFYLTMPITVQIVIDPNTRPAWLDEVSPYRKRRPTFGRSNINLVVKERQNQRTTKRGNDNG
jgi:hypothetical protein